MKEKIEPTFEDEARGSIRLGEHLAKLLTLPNAHAKMVEAALKQAHKIASRANPR